MHADQPQQAPPRTTLQHREALAQASLERQHYAEQQVAALDRLLEQNTKLTEQVEKLTAEIHRTVVT